MINLSKLKQVHLREAWKNEATDFKNWLAEDELEKLLLNTGTT